MATAVANIDRRSNVRAIREREARGMSWDDAIESFLLSRKRGIEGAKTQARPRTIREYRNDLTIFVNWVSEHKGHTHYNQLKRADMIDFIDWAQNPKPNDWRRGPWSKASQNKIFRTLRAFFHWVDKSDECADEDMRGWQRYLPVIPRNQPRRMTVDKKSVKAFLNGINTKTRTGARDFTITSLVVDAGLRIGEIRHLLMRQLHVDADRPFVLVPEEGKTGERVVWLGQDMARRMKMWIRRREKFAKPGVEHVFLTNKGEPLSELTMTQTFRRLRQRMKMSGITAHQFRHFYVTDYLRRSNGEIGKLMAQTGHKSMDTLGIYMHLANDESVAEAQQKFSPLSNLTDRT